ncbi:MAG: discoidin domain-containing protein [Psychromonas sp.]
MNRIKKLGLFVFTLSTSFVNATTLNIETATDWGNSASSYPASNTIDGSLSWSSRWAASGSPVNLQLDLGSVKSVTDVGISWGRGGERSFTFEIWARATTSGTWTKVYDDVSTGSTSSIEVYDITNIDAQQVRVKTFSNTAGTDWTDIKEVEIYGGTSTNGEFTITEAFDDGTGHNNYPASNAIDNNSAWSSRWAASNDGEAVNLTLQLDETRAVTEVAVAWGKGELRSHTFEIYARPGTSGSWTKVYDSISSGSSSELEVYNVTDIDAQQIRIKGQSNSAGSDWTNITEVKVYGADSLDDGTLDWDWSVWDTEGYDPTVGSTMVFDALTAQHITPNGNGWRHELKIKEDERVAMTEVYEDFQATIHLNLSDGSKTIVAQHHASDTGTIMKLYVSDSSESGFTDSIANNGIFDVYVRLAKEDGSGEEKKSLGTAVSGDSFDFQVINDHGNVTVSAFGESFNLSIEDSSESYLKFGNYLQAQDSESLEDIEDSDDFEQFYIDAGITESELTFSNLSYTRNVD